MPNIVPYINFVDKSRDAVEFYKSIFGGAAELQLDGDRVIHLDFQAGGIHFMGSDLQGDQADLGFGNGYTLVLNCDSEVQLRDFYSKLIEGGEEVFAPVDGGWGAIVAHCNDQFGLTWMLNYDIP
jgi:PhnB protein